jgi:hypothetical protein
MKIIDNIIIEELIQDTLIRLKGFTNDEKVSKDDGMFCKLTENPDKRYYQGYLNGLLTIINCNYKEIKKDVFKVFNNDSKRTIWTFDLREYD